MNNKIGGIIYAHRKIKGITQEELLNCSDEGIKIIIRNVDNVTLVTALSGASGTLCKKFLSNISDKLLHFINQDIKNCNVALKDIINAQKEMLQLAVELGIIEVG